MESAAETYNFKHYNQGNPVIVNTFQEQEIKQLRKLGKTRRIETGPLPVWSALSLCCRDHQYKRYKVAERAIKKHHDIVKMYRS